jgi:Holliday junction resolvase-like predicted endonuclease
MSDKGSLVFVEVKTRATTAFGLPEEAVGRVKRQRLQRIGAAYMAEKGVSMTWTGASTWSLS